jgi:hypothetical protein
MGKNLANEFEISVKLSDSIANSQIIWIEYRHDMERKKYYLGEIKALFEVDKNIT